MGVNLSKAASSDDSRSGTSNTHNSHVAPFDFSSLSQHYVIDESSKVQFETLEANVKTQITGAIVGVARCFYHGMPAIIVVNRVVWFAVRILYFRKDEKVISLKRLGGFNSYKQAHAFTCGFALQHIRANHSSLSITEAYFGEEVKFLFQHVLVTKAEQLLASQDISLPNMQAMVHSSEHIDNLLLSLVALLCLDDILTRKVTDACFGLIPLSSVLYTSAGAPQSMRAAVCYLVSLRCFLGDEGKQQKQALARALLASSSPQRQVQDQEDKKEVSKTQQDDVFYFKPALNLLASLSEEVANWPFYRAYRDLAIDSLKNSLVLQGKLAIPSSSAYRVMCVPNDGRFRITSGTCFLVDLGRMNEMFFENVQNRLNECHLPFGPYFLDSFGRSMQSFEELKEISQPTGNCLVYLSTQEQLVLKAETTATPTTSVVLSASTVSSSSSSSSSPASSSLNLTSSSLFTSSLKARKSPSSSRKASNEDNKTSTPSSSSTVSSTPFKFRLGSSTKMMKQKSPKQQPAQKTKVPSSLLSSCSSSSSSSPSCTPPSSTASSFSAAPIISLSAASSSPSAEIKTGEFQPVPGPPLKMYPGHTSYTNPDIHTGMSRAVQEYGTLVELNILGITTYVVREPAYVLAMLDSAPNKHLPDVDLAGGKAGLFFSDGAHWNFVRSTMNPCFYPVRIERMLSAFVVKVKIMLQCIEEESSKEKDKVFDMWKWSERLFYDIMCDVGLDHKAEFFLEKGTQPKIIKLFNSIYEAEKIRQFRPKFLNRLYTPFNNRFQENVTAIYEECDKIIEARMKKSLDAGSSNKSDGSSSNASSREEGKKLKDEENDILISLLQAKCPGTEQKMNREMLRAQILNLLRAGTDTTASCLCWVTYCLSQNPEEEALVLEEMRSIFGHPSREVNPTAVQLKQLKYLDLVIKEAMRLHPPAVIVFRTLDKDLILDNNVGGKYKLLAGSRMIVDICGLHKDPKFWGSDSLLFKPKRFLDMSSIKMGQYIPFGGGNRTCIGNTMGLLEVKAALTVMYMRCCVLSGGRPVILSPEPNRPLNMMMVLQPHPLLQTTSSQVNDLSLPPSPPLQRSFSSLYTFAESQHLASLPTTASTTAASNRGKVSVLYGSNQGTCQMYAQQFASRVQQFTAGGTTVVAQPCDSPTSMSDLLNSDVEGNHSVVIICSTYNGQPPDNARKFMDWLNKLTEDKQAASPLRHLRYLVVGVGNTLWAPTWQRIPSLIDKQFALLGGSRLMSMACVNMDADPEREFQTCCGLALRELKREMGVISLFSSNPMIPDTNSWIIEDMIREEGNDLLSNTSSSSSSLSPASDAYSPPSLEYCQLSSVSSASPSSSSSPSASISEFESSLLAGTPMKVLKMRELHSATSERSCTHLEVALPPNICYHTGDHLMIYAENHAELVVQLAARCGVNLNTTCFLHRPNDPKIHHPLFYGVSLRWALTFHCHITTPPSRQCLAVLASLTPSAAENHILLELSSNLTQYTQDVLRPALTFCEVLTTFCASLSSVPIDRLLSLLPPLLPRFYSISSSPLAHPSSLTCTIAKVSYCPSNKFPPRIGVVSGSIGNISQDNSLRCAIVGSPFRLPSSVETPIICIGAGTGLAPFMGFFEERAHLKSQGVKLGEALLFFGCREATKDFIYQKELEGWVAQGVISQLIVAFSREGQANYVQDKLREHGLDVARMLCQNHGVVYVCGDARFMAKQVDEALRGILSEHGGMPDLASVEQFMTSLVGSARYQRDVWG